jgi:hypothetical protein
MNSALPFMSGRINLIIIEDEASVLSMLRETFSSPYIHIVTASSMKEARKKIARRGALWHCWIVDMCLGGKRDAGTALIEEYGNFPFAIIYSGLGSMEGAASAIREGAAAVIDKGADTINKLVWEACGLMPLGMLCNGVIRKKKEMVFLFREHTIRDPSEWADRAGITLRQVENISITATGMAPSYVIPFYYGLRFLLAASLGVEKKFIGAKDMPFCRSSVEYLVENQTYYRNVFFQ